MHHPDGMSFAPEELLAMVIEKAKSDAELAAGDGQSIKDVVIAIPPYYTQRERRAVIHSAKFAGLKVLQLINVNTAVALNYGVFRRKDFNESANYILFYDMGASSTVATVAAYQTSKSKERGFLEVNPLLSIKGVGFDRTLGGLEMQFRLRDYLAKQFIEKSKKSADRVTSNKRAMSKLFKEAGRVKRVLSANAEHVAQVENVMDDIDLKTLVKRSDFEEMCADLLGQRLTKPIEVALESAGLSIDYMDQVILFGGNTRMPKIQEVLLNFLKIKELGKSVNADEAAAMGASYQAAYLSKGFKVKTFLVKEANLYPIQVDFSREVESQDGGKKTRVMQRTLFSRNNLYPSKKVLTFSRHADDFDFFVKYGDLKGFLTDKDIAALGPLNISRVKINGLTESLTKNKDENKEYKGTRAHFRLDESGLITMDSVESVFEAKVEEIVTDSDGVNTVGDALAKLGNTIGKLFRSSEKEPTPDSESQSNETRSEDTPAEDGKSTNDTKFEAKKDANESQPQTEPKKEIKIKTIKEPLAAEREYLDLPELSSEEEEASIKKLRELSDKDQERHRRDSLKNNLEAFIHETKLRLGEDEYIKSSTEQERETILSALKSASLWLEEESDNAESKVFETKVHDLMKIARKVFERVKEHQERPEAVKALNEILNITNIFYQGAKNASADDQIFTDVEVETLGKLVNETTTWRDKAIKEQKSIPRYENPKLLVHEIREKIVILDREVKYLVNKARIKSIQKKTTEKTEKANTSASENVTIEVNEGGEEKSKSESEEPLTEKPLKIPESEKSDNKDKHSQADPSSTIKDSHSEL